MTQTRLRSKATTLWRGHVPEGIIQFLYEKNALVHVTSSGSSESLGDEAPLVDRLPSNMKIKSVEDDSFDRSIPVMFPSGDEQALGARLRGLPGQLGQLRVDKTAAEMLDKLPSGSMHIMQRLEPNGFSARPH